MELPSTTFFSLLEEGVRQRAEELKMEATIAMAPEMKPADWKRFVNKLDDMTTTTDILEVDNVNKLKDLFGQSR